MIINKFNLTTIIFLVLPILVYSQDDFIKETIMPYQNEHVHGSTLVELPNGDILTAWFQGSGERWADDVLILGARKKSGSSSWSEPFEMANVKEFPDINPILFIDGRERLWLMWYTVIANQWETSLINYRISKDYQKGEGAPKWDWQQNLLVKPGDKAERGILQDDKFVESVNKQIDDYTEYLGTLGDESLITRWDQRAERIRQRAAGQDMVRAGHRYSDDGTYEVVDKGYPYFRRMGWQTRSKPTILESGRIILPLYSDGFGFSLMAITDDWGENWTFSSPLVGAGNIQASIAVAKNGNLVAYMRDNGPAPKRMHISRSSDDGETWSSVKNSELPNPGSAPDVVTLKDGSWVMIYNDTERGRHSLVVSLSEDDGETWPWTRTIEFDEQEEISAHYPAIIQGRNGDIHISYSLFLPELNREERKTVVYAKISKDWIKD